MEAGATVLLAVSSSGRRQRLLSELQREGAAILEASSCQEAYRLLRREPLIDLVVTDLSHQDGNWCDILGYIVQLGLPSSVVVTTSMASEVLWSEVLWRGVYDMLVEPYETGELQQVIEGALRSTKAQREQTKLREAALISRAS
jgi:DNA-binding NtrC family response regulator